MRRLTILLLILLVLVAGVGAVYVTGGLDVVTSASDLATDDADSSTSLVEMHRALTSTPQTIDLKLEIDVPKKDTSLNPKHQEIDGEGFVDLESGTGELIYDFNGLSNAAALLGDFDTMDMVFDEDSIYAEVFVSGPPWLRIAPQDLGNGDVGRLHDMLLTTPRTLPAYLEVEATDEDVSSDGISRSVSPGALSDAGDPFAAAIGAVLEEWKVESMQVDLRLEDREIESMILSFSYAPYGFGDKIDVTATYELSPDAGDVEVEVPPSNDVREYSEIFSSS